MKPRHGYNSLPCAFPETIMEMMAGSLTHLAWCRIYALMNCLSIGSDNGLSPVGCKPLSEPMLDYYQLDLSEQPSVKFESKYKIFIPEKASENTAVEMAAILSRERRVNITDQKLRQIKMLGFWLTIHDLKWCINDHFTIHKYISFTAYDLSWSQPAYSA